MKTGQIKQSLDWVQSNDYEMVSNVLGELDFIKQIFFFSDKCSINEVRKMEEDFNKDLAKKSFPTKVIQLAKYLKNFEKVVEKTVEEESKDPNDAPAEEEKIEITTEIIVSRNPKINVLVSPGLAKQIKDNTNLLHFKLLYWRLHPNAWKNLGQALGKNQNL